MALSRHWMRASTTSLGFSRAHPYVQIEGGGARNFLSTSILSGAGTVWSIGSAVRETLREGSRESEGKERDLEEQWRR